MTDGGHFTRWIVDGISTPSPSDFIWTLDFAAIGQGLGAGIGAALATPDRPTYVFCGDAGSMMAIQEIETAARYDLPITIFVLNDETLGSEYHNLAPTGGYAEAARIAAPEFSDVATAFGATGATVTDLTDLDSLTPPLDAHPDGPRVIDCKINHQVRHRSKR